MKGCHLGRLIFKSSEGKNMRAGPAEALQWGYIEGRAQEEMFMSDTVVDSLILDLLEWIARRDRSYEEVMAAWRTSCPKLPIWEEANDRGLVEKEEVNGRSIVRISSSGRILLERSKSLQGERPIDLG
jgi:D-3-phosphoglycerate dehydrogenase